MSSALDLAHRFAYRIGFRLARIVWRLLRPSHQGALVGIHVGPDLLLVRQSYRSEYTLPGGGLKTGEQAADAARRELHEELGLSLAPGSIEPVCTETALWDGRRDTVAFFALSLAARPDLAIDNREIVDTRFVTPQEARGLRLTGPAAHYLDVIAPPRNGRPRTAAPRPPP